MKFENTPADEKMSGSEGIELPLHTEENSTPDVSRNKRVNAVMRYIAAGLATIGAAAHENNNEARAQNPLAPAALAAATTDMGSPSPLENETVTRTKIDKWKAEIRTSGLLAISFQNIANSPADTKVILQSSLLTRIIKTEMPKTLEPEHMRALQEIAYELAVECGNYKEAIQHHRITNEKNTYAKAEFVKEELAFLTKAESLTINQYPTKKKEIGALVANRRLLLQALANPDLPQSKHAIGVYLFFECEQDEGLAFIAAAGEHLAMAALAKDPMNATLWEKGINNVPTEWRKAVSERAAKLKAISGAVTGSTEQSNAAANETVAQAPSTGVPPVQPQAKNPSTVTNAATKPLTGKKFNAFQFTNPARYTINAKSGFTPDGKLFLNADSMNGSTKILFPMVPTGSFNIRAEIDANQGRKLYRMVLPVGSGEVWVTRHANKVSLHQNDGGVIQHEEKEPTKKPLELKDKTTFDIDVIDKHGGVYNVVVRIDGEEIFNELYEEVPVSVNKGGMWILTKQSLGVWAHGTNLNANSYVITAVNGRPVEPVR